MFDLDYTRTKVLFKDGVTMRYEQSIDFGQNTTMQDAYHHDENQDKGGIFLLKSTFVLTVICVVSCLF